MDIFSPWGNPTIPEITIQDEIFDRLQYIYFEYFYPHLCALIQCENVDSIFRF